MTTPARDAANDARNDGFVQPVSADGDVCHNPVAARVDLSRVDRLWRCTGCGYFAYSFPVEDIVDEDGKDAGAVSHVCPECGEQDWHWCGGDSREKRIGYLQAVLLGR